MEEFSLPLDGPGFGMSVSLDIKEVYPYLTDLVLYNYDGYQVLPYNI
jgi:hypothetical protein